MLKKDVLWHLFLGGINFNIKNDFIKGKEENTKIQYNV